MDEQKIRQMVRQEIQANSSASRFSINTIPRHIHNGTDSPFALQPVMTYVGRVSSTGAAQFLPSGWSATRNSTGAYTITHNLGTTNYVPTGNANSTKTVLIVTDISSNTFTINMFETIFLALVNSDFLFSLTCPTNKFMSIPNYTS